MELKTPEGVGHVLLHESHSRKQAAIWELTLNSILMGSSWDYTAAWRAAQCRSEQRKGAWKFMLQTSESSLLTFEAGFETLLAKVGLKISGCHVFYGVTFPGENLTAFHVVFSGLLVLVSSRSR